MHPIANPFYALSGLVQSMHAELATKYSFAVTMYPFQSACSAIPPLHILTFSNSDSPRPSSPDLSQDTRKTFYSLKNLPCFQPHKPPSHMNDYYTTFICNYATFTPKSNNLTISNTIFSLLKIIYYDKLITTLTTQTMTMNLSSFIAVLIPNAMVSCLPLGSVPHVTSTPVRTAAN